MAIFDIITHLTEKEKLLRCYDLYLNMSGRKSFAEFEYVFIFDGHEVVYKYKKMSVNTLQDESLSIDEKEVVHYDFIKGEGFTQLEGSETLNAAIKSDSPISRVKYVNSNSILADNIENQVFKKFIDFVKRMLLFYSLDSRGYEGYRTGSESVADGRKSIYCRFDNQDVDFFKIASTGTRSLALLSESVEKRKYFQSVF